MAGHAAVPAGRLGVAGYYAASDMPLSGAAARLPVPVALAGPSRPGRRRRPRPEGHFPHGARPAAPALLRLRGPLGPLESQPGPRWRHWPGRRIRPGGSFKVRDCGSCTPGHSVALSGGPRPRSRWSTRTRSRLTLEPNYGRTRRSLPPAAQAAALAATEDAAGLSSSESSSSPHHDAQLERHGPGRHTRSHGRATRLT